MVAGPIGKHLILGLLDHALPTGSGAGEAQQMLEVFGLPRPQACTPAAYPFQ